jgi:hypothetical protein
MSTDLVRDLFHSLETTLHDRLKVIEELLVRSSDSRNQSSLNDWKKITEELQQSFAKISGRVESLEISLSSLNSRMNTFQASRADSIETKPIIDRPVEAEEAAAEEDAAIVAEAEVLEVEKEEEEEVEVEEEEEEEVEEEELEEFEYKGNTWYRNTKNEVYGTDEEGNLVDEIVGIWNPKTQKITRVPS